MGAGGIAGHDQQQSQLPFENLRPLGFSPITRGPEFAWSNLSDKKKVFYKETEFLLSRILNSICVDML